VHPFNLKAGDCVLFGKWSGAGRRGAVITKESDMMGLVEGGAAAAKTS
jgi:co-chaperonin GroES (HSP10)